MNVLSLFSGIGGIDLGLERAGMTVVGQVEIDPWCRKVLAKHWPEVPRHDDVRTAADWWGGRPAPDLVAGGFPCQPVSLAGKGLAQADSRWLWPAFAGIIRQLRPRYVLVENVPGLLGRGLGDVLGDLAELGYDAEWDCVSASAVGAPHIRDRVWIVAHSSGPGLAQREGQPGDDGAQLQAAQRGRVRAGDVANTPSPDDGRGDTTASPRSTPQPGSDRGPADVANTQGQRSELRATQGERPGRPTGGRARWPRPAASDWWASEPDVGRVAHGIPGRVDRLRGLGNAVVPQVAEHIGRMILDAAA